MLIPIVLTLSTSRPRGRPYRSTNYVRGSPSLRGRRIRGSTSLRGSYSRSRSRSAIEGVKYSTL